MKKFIWILFLVIIATYNNISNCQSTNNIAVASFILNGDTATLPSIIDDNDPLNGNLYLHLNKLTLHIAAKVRPEVSLTLDIVCIEFDDSTLQANNPIATLFRRKSWMDNLVPYSSIKSAGENQGYFKLTISKYTLLSLPSKNQYGEALLSGIFEGDLNCSSDPCMPGETQHIVSGKFENVKIALWK